MLPHDYWQALTPAPARLGPTASGGFCAGLADGQGLDLPVRLLADGQHGLASLIINQASFAVQAALAADLAARLLPFAPEVVVGLPTLGLTLAEGVARQLGHDRYVPFGTSRKFWYREELSVPLSSITTPDQKKRLYVDPRLVPLIEGRRVALIDDVLSSGASIIAGLKLLASVGITPVVVGAAMLQTRRWCGRIEEMVPGLAVVGCFSTPLLRRTEAGDWRVDAADQ